MEKEANQRVSARRAPSDSTSFKVAMPRLCKTGKQFPKASKKSWELMPGSGIEHAITN